MGAFNDAAGGGQAKRPAKPRRGRVEDVPVKSGCAAYGCPRPGTVRTGVGAEYWCPDHHRVLIEGGDLQAETTRIKRLHRDGHFEPAEYDRREFIPPSLEKLLTDNGSALDLWRKHLRRFAAGCDVAPMAVAMACTALRVPPEHLSILETAAKEARNAR